MNKHRLFYLIFVIVCTVLMFSYRSKLTSVLFLFSLLMPILSLLLGFAASKLIKAKMEYRVLYAEKMEAFTVSLKLTNRFIIPIAPAGTIGYFPLRSTSLFEYQNILMSISPFSTVNINFSTPIKLRGVYDCGIEKIETYDFLRLFKFTRKIEQYEKIVILPRKHIISPVRDISSSDSETESVNNFSFEKNSFTNIREYIPGDPVKHIHWKMSAKQDKLMVKQFEQSIGGTAIAIADLNEYSPFDEENAEKSDCIIETLIAINMMLINERQSCLNLWYSPLTKTCEQRLVKNNDDFSLFYNTMSILPRQQDTFLPENLVKSIGEVPTDSGSVYFITSQLRNDFISIISGIELFRNKKIRILFVESDELSEEQKSLIEAISSAPGTELWRIDRNNLVSSLGHAIELYRNK
ncbi:MAG: DUF58 domain-containing protein [Ruminiclostridium sp.]|nr:DUF58 domain-containing protein [Ruminiclostridium sp.]